MGQNRLILRLLAAAVAVAYGCLIVYAILPQPLSARPQPVSFPAESDFRANDRDWNHVNDFWCGVSGLYTMTSVQITGGPSEIELIELSLEEDQNEFTPSPLHPR
jgi:hypothetical protein